MPTKTDRIITSVYLTKEMCGQIDKLADREHISRNEQIRRFIEKGLTVDGYTKDIDFIAGIIRQEFTSVYHIEDIKAVMEQQTNRLAKMLMKSGKLDGAAFFLLIKVLMNMAHDGTEDEFDQMLNEAVTLGVDYMQKKDFQINSFLQDTDNLRRLADKL
ncbi:ribbon-helix-helix domain-containing protein [Butyricicoccus faecihominis]|uniref:ribbon-helix-helix domain-containing protein n=1 Tax=Butyricicoccus faecihominis TaxID=1712515 RepID=UPI00247969BB|nr:ribbon-helix-helix domain-containing protein [Butyricicoccus faecihominis]MCQ5128938.1 ribbon-helix-helix domain-containing protein [Butyricicoccus faecihominis]